MTETDLYTTRIYNGGNRGCCCSNTGPAGPMGSQGAIGPQGPQGETGPAGEPATSENAMRYNAGAQTLASGGILSLATSVVNSTGDITAPGVMGLTMTPGQYLLTFVTDASAADSGNLGAVLTLNGAPLAYAASQLTIGGTTPNARLALHAILNLTAAGTVTVVNNTANTVTYTNAVLTAVKLA